MFMAPLSEVYGRKPVCVICLAVFTVLIIPCALAKSVTTLIVVRFIGAFFGSVMISTAPGMVADLVDDEHRALAISIWSIGPLNGPGMFSFFLGVFCCNSFLEPVTDECSHWPGHWRLRH
jgi:MFS family permease